MITTKVENNTMKFKMIGALTLTMVILGSMMGFNTFSVEQPNVTTQKMTIAKVTEIKPTPKMTIVKNAMVEVAKIKPAPKKINVQKWSAVVPVKKRIVEKKNLGAFVINVVTVQEGDTITTIAKELFGNVNDNMVEDIVDANPDIISADGTLPVGSTIKLPMTMGV